MNNRKENEFLHTEIGQIPCDWSLSTYDKLFEFLSSATYSRAELSSDSEIGYIHYGDIHRLSEGFLDLEQVELPSIEQSKAKEYSLVKDGDLIVADVSEDYSALCKSAEIRNIRSKVVISGLHTFLLRSKNDDISNGYKAYLHQNIIIKKQIDVLATGIKVYGISKSNLKKVCIPLPPIKEQKAIAEALNDIDTLVYSLESLIEKKNAIKQGALHELLQPKDDWVERTLGEVFDINAGGDFKGEHASTYQNENFQYPVYSNALTNDGLYCYYDYYTCNEHCITVTARGTIGHAVYRDHKFVPIGRLLILRPNEEIGFTYFTEYINKKVKFVHEVTGVPQLTAPQIASYVVFSPPISEQLRISTVLLHLDSEINILGKKVEKYKNIKQGMMNLLLTGKVRLL